MLAEDVLLLKKVATNLKQKGFVPVDEITKTTELLQELSVQTHFCGFHGDYINIAHCILINNLKGMIAGFIAGKEHDACEEMKTFKGKELLSLILEIYKYIPDTQRKILLYPHLHYLFVLITAVLVRNKLDGHYLYENFEWIVKPGTKIWTHQLEIKNPLEDKYIVEIRYNPLFKNISVSLKRNEKVFKNSKLKKRGFYTPDHHRAIRKNKHGKKGIIQINNDTTPQQLVKQISKEIKLIYSAFRDKLTDMTYLF